jgi:tetratricopeptide (TPR) repeat protein
MDRSPFHVEPTLLTRAGELRDRLAQLEAQVGQLGYGLGPEALAILLLFDEVWATLAALRAEGLSMRAEEARLETVAASLKRKAAVFLRELGGTAVLRDARHTRQPDQADWWWFLDQFVAKRRKAFVRRLLLFVAGVAAILLLLALVYQQFLAPDPAREARFRHERQAVSLALDGDFISALSETERALAVAPGDPDLLVLKGVLQQELGQVTVAEETFAAAEAAFEDRESFLTTRGQWFLQLGQAEAALADVEAAIALNSQSAIAHLLLGMANEALENYSQALAAYEQASALADLSGDAEINVMARIRIGEVLLRLKTTPEDRR